MAEELKNQIRMLPRRRLWRYGPVIVCAVLIFIGSGNVLSGPNTAFLGRFVRYLFPGASPETIHSFHYLVRKMGHVTEYAILAALAARAFRTSSIGLLRQRWAWAAILLVILYALSDEFHQSFVPTRGASIYDSMIDTVGGLIGLMLYWWWLHRRKRKKVQAAVAVKAGAAA